MDDGNPEQDGTTNPGDGTTTDPGDDATTNAADDTTTDAADDTSGDSGETGDPPPTDSELLENVAYANISDAQMLDLYIPAGEGPFAVVVLIHGGGFEQGDKSASATSAQFLASNGIAAAAINYRLSGEATFPAAVHDCKAAVRFLRTHASDYRLDPDRIGAWGESAGANLASMLGTSSGDAYTEDLALSNADVSSSVSTTISWFPPVNFLTIDQEAAALGLNIDTNAADSFESKYMGFPVQEDPDQVALANPTTYIDRDDSAFLVQAGDEDPLMPYTQSQNFHAALEPVLGPDRAQFDLLVGSGHGSGDFQSDENLARVLAFLESHL
ncbi:MAG: alpha/beta hydrolase [Myxococcota bacterium]